MPDITTEYRGYTIRWSDNQDCWVCFDAGRGVEHVSLAKVKEAIDRLNLKQRKESAFACFELSDRHNSVSKTEASIIEYMGAKIERPAWHESDRTPKIVGHKVAATAIRDGHTRITRRETELKNFMPDTPEAHVAFRRAELAAELVREASALFKLALSQIPSVSVEQIAPLVKLYEAENEG